MVMQQIIFQGLESFQAHFETPKLFHPRRNQHIHFNFMQTASERGKLNFANNNNNDDNNHDFIFIPLWLNRMDTIVENYPTEFPFFHSLS
jgi:hypothetical protein